VCVCGLTPLLRVDFTGRSSASTRWGVPTGCFPPTPAGSGSKPPPWQKIPRGAPPEIPRGAPLGAQIPRGGAGRFTSGGSTWLGWWRASTGARRARRRCVSFISRASVLEILLTAQTRLVLQTATYRSQKRSTTRVAAPSPRANLGRRTVCGRTEQRQPPVSKRYETQVRMVWGSFLIAAAALKTPTRNGYNAQGVNRTLYIPPTNSVFMLNQTRASTGARRARRRCDSLKKMSFTCGDFPRLPKTVGPGNKKPVTKHAKRSIRWHLAFIGLQWHPLTTLHAASGGIRLS